MRIKGWFEALRDRKLDLQERLFRLLVTIGLCGLAAAIINGIVIGEAISNILAMVIACCILVVIVYLSIRYHRIQLGAAIIGAIIIYLMLPFNFLTAGGIYGGAPIYLLFGMIYVCLVVEGKIKYVYLISSYIVSLGCYYVTYSNPALVVRHTTETAYIDSIISLLTVGLWICGMVLFQNRIFRSENAVVEEQKKEIEELNRAQSRFFSSMSHEIRTPINTIIGLNEMILREDLPAEVAADAMNIQSASSMLLSLINDFLDMSKIESGRMDIVPVTYDVGDMLSDVVNMIWIRAKEKGLAFHIDVGREVPAKLYGDEVRIKQILTNLLHNAVKYTMSGSITLSIQIKENRSDYVRIMYSVADTGIGIKKENIPYLFNAFKRGNDEESHYIEGTGLGLAIVKQMVELMDGDVAVNSVYTKGTTFVVTLPQKVVGEEKIGNLDLKAERTLSTQEHYKQSFEAPEAHILIVDDNEMNLVVEEGLLHNTKVQVDTVSSGAECLRKTLVSRYDVILMDHLMPGMNGIECLHALREQAQGLNRNTPVVILTANAGSENRALYRKEGFDGYLPKPVTGTLLEEELLKHLPKNLVSMTGVADTVGIIESPILEHKKTMSVMISTDSVCDLPDDLVKQNRIAVMPFRLRTENAEFLDGVEAESDGILSYMSGKGKNVKSVSPEVSDYEKFFAELLTRTQYIIHITTARHASEGYANASEAAKAFDNVTVIDSGHLSSGMGLIVLRAAEYAVGGMGVDEILEKVEPMKRRTRTSFIVESTEYLARSGRIPSKVNEICKSLMLHPVLVLKKSDITVGAVRIGAKDYVRRKYITSTLRTIGSIDTRMLFITYAGLSRAELDEIKRQVQEKMTFDNIICQKASSAISTHCGPGTFGLLYMMK